MCTDSPPGGGFGGKKESGQLRFGGRERPFRKPMSVDVVVTMVMLVVCIIYSRAVFWGVRRWACKGGEGDTVEEVCGGGERERRAGRGGERGEVGELPQTEHPGIIQPRDGKDMPETRTTDALVLVRQDRLVLIQL